MIVIVIIAIGLAVLTATVEKREVPADLCDHASTDKPMYLTTEHTMFNIIFG